MIRVHNLSKHYGPTIALRNFSCTAEQGEIVGLLGPNGAGKTTTLRLLSTFLTPSSGSATVAGFDLVREAEKVRAAVGYVPEIPALYPELTVTQYLSFVLELRSFRKRQRLARIEELLQRCSLEQVRNKLCRHLSRGYRQRVGIAQAIAHNPTLLILDEPTSGLDPEQIKQTRGLIRGLAHGRSVILSTHILSEVHELCSKVVILARGCVVLESALKDLPTDRTLEQIFLDSIGACASLGNSAEDKRKTVYAGGRQ